MLWLTSWSARSASSVQPHSPTLSGRLQKDWVAAAYQVDDADLSALAAVKESRHSLHYTGKTNSNQTHFR